MTSTVDTLTITCSRGHWLLRIGPDPERAGDVTIRWHEKQHGGYQVKWARYPVPPGAAGTAVRVGCRHTRVRLDAAMIAQWYQGGLRSRVRTDQLPEQVFTH